MPIFKKIDSFARNILVVFAGTTLLNVFNLLYQLIIAHKLPADEFAAFNSLIAVFMIIAAPLNTLQLAVTKYVSEFHARGQADQLKQWLSGLITRNTLWASGSFFVFTAISLFALRALKITDPVSGYLLALLLASIWFLPVVTGAVQGLELFGWFSSVSLGTGAVKLLLTAVFIGLGYSVAGALGALLAANTAAIVICAIPLRRYLSLRFTRSFQYRPLLRYLLPVALSYCCFMVLVSGDMIVVRYFFSTEESGFYSLAQIIGKIFLFLPGAVSMVMFPRTSALQAQKKDTLSTLKRSMGYVAWLCCAAALVYNLFPAFIFKVVAGKIYPESILLGRVFGVSMGFYTLSYLLISYYLSVNDFRFVRFLAAGTLIQSAALIVFHESLLEVQLICCANAVLLFAVLKNLLGRRGYARDGAV